MAFTQHLTFLREHAGKTAAATWRLDIHRASLVEDVLAHFGRLKHRGQLWRGTAVGFLDELGQREEGMDQGHPDSNLTLNPNLTLTQP